MPAKLSVCSVQVYFDTAVIDFFCVREEYTTSVPHFGRRKQRKQKN
jgi:hypothetical protein